MSTSDRPFVSELHDLFDCSSLGVLTWKKRISNRNKIGDIAGTIDGYGYRKVMIRYVNHPAQDIVWAMTYGEWPEKWVDHKNRVRDDNRPCNLRLATRSQNQHNQGLSRSNTSGIKGVYFNKRRGKWRAQIVLHGKVTCLGDFSDINDAAKARAAATHQMHGEFGVIVQ